MDGNNLVTVHNLTFRHGEQFLPQSGAQRGRLIFDNISLEVPRGKITAILGPSGIGKTTLLKLISGQLTPERGEILFYGSEREPSAQSAQSAQNVHQLSRRELFALRQRMGMLFQSGALLSDLTVFDNVAYPIREHTDLPEPVIRSLVLLKLEAVGLRGARDLLPGQLSGGMARRVALARAIALDPELVLYDEPFVGQDPISMGVLVKLIKSLNDAFGLTSIVVSHDVPELLSIADHCYVIADQQIIGQGSAQELKQLDSPQVKQFLEGRPDGPVPFHYPAPEITEDLARLR